MKLLLSFIDTILLLASQNSFFWEKTEYRIWVKEGYCIKIIITEDPENSF